MSDSHDPADFFRDLNLSLLGRAITLPLPADAERRARWQMPTTTPTLVKPASSRPRRLAWVAIFSTSGLAAAIAGMLFWGSNAATTVSTQMILEQFRQALSGALSIKLQGIDLGTSVVSGDIVLDRRSAKANPQTDTLYSELHVLMKPGNPNWNDIDAVVVTCQSPTDAWRYCRGNGGGVGFGIPHVTPTEFFVRGSQWREFVSNPVNQFDSLCSRFEANSSKGGATYELSLPQRDFFRRLLTLLLDLSDPNKAPALITQLQSLAGEQKPELTSGGSAILRIANCGEIPALKPPPLQDIPDPRELTKDVVWELDYSATEKAVGISRNGNIDPRFNALGISLNHDVNLPLQSLDALVDHCKSLGCKVTKKRNWSLFGEEWTVRVIGYPFAIETHDRDWMTNVLPGLLSKLTLQIHYDAATSRVNRAEFSNVACPAGHIILDMGEVQLDPKRLDPTQWSKDAKSAEPAGEKI